MVKRRIVITGFGTVTPLGNDVDSNWNAMKNGLSGVDIISGFDASDMAVQIAAEVKNFDPVALFGNREARRMDPFAQFALAAAIQAVSDSGITINEGNSHRAGVVIGSGIGGIQSLIGETLKVAEKGYRWISPHLIPMMISDTAPAKIAIEFGMRGPNMSIATACASSTNAIGESAAIIARGDADIMVTGGAEAAVVKLALAGFDNMGALSRRNDDPKAACRPFDRERDGFIAGEGAVMLVLESVEHAEARGAHIYSEILGYGSSEDAFHVTAPLEDGFGAGLAIQAALDNAGLTPTDIDYLNAHGTSTSLNDKSETMAIKQVFGEYAYKVPISSTKSVSGHLMGAAGALEILACTKAIAEGIIPPTINQETPDPECDLDYVPNTARQAEVRVAMSNSFGFGGHNACLIVGKYQ